MRESYEPSHDKEPATGRIWVYEMLLEHAVYCVDLEDSKYRYLLLSARPFQVLLTAAIPQTIVSGTIAT
jgi:hypothetical protein